ncbi:MAG: tRNA (adenosine(37)-N6)-threonylcarbamoyltransferase complex dimerization subunit type 1 TsaB [Salinisphaera sp.]|nr:tRNA (adenosine(37)-N6)-threonylcarbamoyltransferase complex dimerization subunit type 1 TsaB [Salinisphaera sp.]MDN5938222.1 tRNA (adenosine(37)-N6)-threonylcarbamoyltransferase complex dimerization subunit type 1 TsaB [Salinisphaera sp.]
MKILALDAATEACSAALYDDGSVDERFAIAPREHARLLLPMAQALLQRGGYGWRDLDALAFGRGPGAFTGLRIAAGLIQGLALGSQLPVLPVSNLAALAARSMRLHGAQRILVVNDARMNEVYFCSFDGSDKQGAPIPLGPEQLVDPARLCDQVGDCQWLPAGNAWAACAAPLAPLAARLAAPLECHAHAEDIATLAAVAFARGEAKSAEQALPVYLRNQIATPVR